MENRFGAFENSDTATIDGERQFGPLEVNQQDLSIKAAIPGQVGSSTRSEAHGLLMAIARRGPVHVGIDNATVVKRANKYLQMVAALC